MLYNEKYLKQNRSFRMAHDTKKYQNLRLKHIIGLAAPQTWTASVLPAFMGGALSFVLYGQWDTVMFLCLLLIAILMQSSVNTLNDYFDFIKKTDTLENSDDPGDAILVYNDLNLKTVRLLGFGFLAGAALPGIWVTIHAGFIPLAIGAVGAAVVIFYSFGKLPISYLPLGEIVSGLVMGGLIPLAVCTALSGKFDTIILIYALPSILGIALLMHTNNISDIERDIPSGKKTISVLVGRSRSKAIYGTIIILWMICIVCLVLIRFTSGTALLFPILVFAVLLTVKHLRLPFTQQSRMQAMAGIVRLKIILEGGYIAAILLHGTITAVRAAAFGSPH